MTDKEKAAWGYLTWVDKSPDVRPSAEGEEAFFAGAEWAEKQSKWIKCSERLPEESGLYLVSRFEGDRGSSLDYNAEFKGWNLAFKGGRENELFPSHWQPLPEAPKEEE